ncbi:hypothetical protein FB45DRAFT_495013 [Roridomyces roridus]|uniref:Uncharacterized protein n=1 Tax=Roridomyces roridus TaxID=1738132 RepID=A0AAD7BVQ8_9AGAR|nr:hypothetical protein FB45DRAFT_495013 [Roridomyces roridus]
MRKADQNSAEHGQPLTSLVSYHNPTSTLFLLSLRITIAMPSIFKVLALVALTISGVLASPQPTRVVAARSDCSNSGSEICHDGHAYPPSPPTHHVPGHLTNAQRLARHLPLKPPTRRSSARRAVASSTPAAPAANRAYIQVVSVDANGNADQTATPLGYVSRRTSHAQYNVGTALEDALYVEPSGHNLITLNSDIPSPAFLGLVQGRDDTSATLAENSFNYLYLALTEQTAPNATPQSVGSSYTAAYGGSNQAESAVWTVDPKSRVLTAQWTNPDGSNGPTKCFSQGSAIYCSGDPDAFNAKYGAAIQRIAFVYVSA